MDSIVKVLPILLGMATSVDGASPVTCQDQTMTAVEGDDVTVTVDIPTLFDMMNGRVDVTMMINGKEITVYSIRHGQAHSDIQNFQFKNRTTLDLRGEVMIFIIYNVTLNDTGLYKVYFRGLGAPCTINLTVVKKSSPTEPPLINMTEPNNHTATTEDPEKGVGAGAQLPTWATVVIGIVVGGILLLAAVLICRWISGRFKKSGGSGANQDIEMEPMQSSTTGGEGVVQNSPRERA